jgi:acyl-CoA thioesterase
MPFYRHLGINLTGLGWGRAEIQLRVERRVTQSAGFAHGGVAAALIDSAVGLALCTMLDPEELITTVELHVSYIAPAEPGVLKSRGKIVHKGKRVAVGDAEVRDERGRLISRGSATYMILGSNRQRILDLS